MLNDRKRSRQNGSEREEKMRTSKEEERDNSVFFLFLLLYIILYNLCRYFIAFLSIFLIIDKLGLFNLFLFQYLHLNVAENEMIYIRKLYRMYVASYRVYRCWAWDAFVLSKLLMQFTR